MKNRRCTPLAVVGGICLDARKMNCANCMEKAGLQNAVEISRLRSAERKWQELAAADIFASRLITRGTPARQFDRTMRSACHRQDALALNSEMLPFVKTFGNR